MLRQHVIATAGKLRKRNSNIGVDSTTVEAPAFLSSSGRFQAKDLAVTLSRLLRAVFGAEGQASCDAAMLTFLVRLDVGHSTTIECIWTC